MQRSPRGPWGWIRGTRLSLTPELCSPAGPRGLSKVTTKTHSPGEDIMKNKQKEEKTIRQLVGSLLTQV